MDDLDHRNLGSRLDLYHLQEDAPGMPFWHPRGHAVYRVLEDYIRARMRRLGYGEIRTPQLMPRSLWEASGHWQKFRRNMFALKADDGREMALKPMSCPCHVQVFNKGLRSWRDLPVRYAEFGACHRDEPSGSMHGLMRTRSFEQDDAHVFCREEQVVGEVSRFVRLLGEVYADLGFPAPEVGLSTRPAERAGDDALWDRAEAILGEAARSCGLDPAVQPGEGAFYGPKLEFALRDGLGRSWQMGTVQLDYVLPGALGASYVDEASERRVPVMIHHAVFGSLGRLIAVLLEHHGGKLPYWLSPDQVAVCPISDAQSGYAGEVHAALLDAGVRAVRLDDGSLPRRIVAANASEIPVVVVVGRREEADRTVALRERDGSQSSMALADLSASLAARDVPGK